ncbi:transmembrane prolyl 4-hydroxylase-like [Acropora palmata]|uniref:transmembrane prolyl 4-hydroxylase-like n=1 Tax=Acropora palmata TaxID=6131 RepID=UPI003DA0F899
MLNFFPTLIVLAGFCHLVCYCGRWSLTTYNYIPVIRSNEKFCYLEWKYATADDRTERFEQSRFKQTLFRLDGIEVGHVRLAHLVPGKLHRIITRSLKPPIFEIPNFLTNEECDYLIKRAEKTGLTLSEVVVPTESHTDKDDFANNCTDNDFTCVRWAKSGECQKNPKYMLKNCQLSCEVCKDAREFHFQHWDLNKDGILSGFELIKATEMFYFLYTDEDDIYEMFLMLNITQFGPGPVCEDNEDSCSQLAKQGTCDLYPAWMLLTCRKSCGNCGCEDLSTNCSSLAAAKKCVDDEHVNWMLRNCRRSCKVCLGAINYETYQSINTNDIFKYLNTMAHKHPRHRSRYSYTAFLHRNELAPLQNMMIDRIEKLTQLPREIVDGAESLQVVKYDKYGHYHAHYDSSPTGDVDMICCHQIKDKTLPCRLCRLVTILYYLNDVDEGGQTAFVIADNSTLNETLLLSKRGKEGDPFNLSNYCQEANFVIAPKRGTAVLWYNHLLDSDSEWLGARDPYTLHGGCDVKKGKKWIANHWIPAPYKNYRHFASIYRKRVNRSGT